MLSRVDYVAVKCKPQLYNNKNVDVKNQGITFIFYWLGYAVGTSIIIVHIYFKFQKYLHLFRVITVFTVFRLLTDFVCLYNYEFGLSLCKIVRSLVILLLPLLVIWCLTAFSTIFLLYRGGQFYWWRKRYMVIILIKGNERERERISQILG